jgi:hypothetical protein
MRMPAMTLFASILGLVACSSSSSTSSGLGTCCAFGEGDDAGDAGPVACVCGSDSTAQSADDPNVTVTFARSTCTIVSTVSFPDSGNTETITQHGSPATSAAQCAPPGASVSSNIQCCIFEDSTHDSCNCSGDATFSPDPGVTVTFDATACTLKTSAVLSGDAGVATVETQGRHATSAAECAAR